MNRQGGSIFAYLSPLKWGLFVFLFILCGFAKKDDAKFMVHQFFTLVYKKRYKEAYSHLSKSVQGEVSLSQFTQSAQNVTYLKLLKIDVLDREDNLIKMKVQALIHLIYKGRLFEAVYEGKVDVYKEGKKWKVMSVDLKAKKQKDLGTPPPEKIQHLDFGT